MMMNLDKIYFKMKSWIFFFFSNLLLLRSQNPFELSLERRRVEG
jgi:hypothetical protein